MADKAEPFTVNPHTPRPCPRHYESIRRAAAVLWGEVSIPIEDSIAWARAGCPDAAGVLFNAATHQPPIPGQAQNDPEEFVVRLIRAGIFVPAV